ncbi:sensor histidine kinase [Actinoplanes sp. NPDC049599]|uniref:sensor histidine kinase n=1 Tax=Actinoplanes sp. NPDC049599 TaxID=3363903 RepID=UPI003788DA70
MTGAATRPAIRLAWAVASVSAVLLVVGLAESLLHRGAGLPAERRDWLLALLCVPLGVRVAAYAPRNPCGWLLSGVGLLASGTVAASVSDAGPLFWTREWLWWPGTGLLILIVVLFPDGAGASRFRRWTAGAAGVATAAGTVALAHLAARAPAGFLTEAVPVSPGWDTVVILAALLVLAGSALLAPVALLTRLRREPAGRRGPLIWATGNAVLLLAGLILDTVAGIPLTWLAVVVAVPVATVVGVVRYHLYDIDLLVHRSVSYGLFTCLAIVTYTATVTVAARLLPAAAPVVAAAAVVALLPLRQRVDALLRRTLYGLSADPYRLTEALNRRIGQARTPEEVLGAAVEVIGEGFRAPYVAIHLGDRSRAESATGRRRDWPVSTVALSHRGARAGRLVVQPRGPDEPWNRRERTLLDHLAGQLAPSAAAVRLTHELRTARERLVQAREEEARRLQRDLHDGVGPTLSGARMLVSAGLAGGGTVDGRANLQQIGDCLTDAAAEIRRLVDGLHPPALERGLAAALSLVVQRHRPGGPRIDLSVDGDLAGLPAPVEVAVFRLVDEGLLNVVRHASAGHARVDVRRVAGTVRVVLDDDGVGGATSRPSGVGLASMSRRCEDLGGTFRIADLHPGTRLSAVIPLV